MEFEGVEKKLEIQLKASYGSLLSLPEAFWQEIVQDAKAAILSQVSNPQCKAYLLSESSLFVFAHHIVLITCGQTTLVEAALSLFKKIPKEEVDFIFYERKNENFPQRQSTSHKEDMEKLSSIFPGKDILLGENPGNHISLFYFSSESGEQYPDSTIEVLMHALSEEVQKFFCKGPNALSKEEVRQKIGIEEFLPGFEVDDHTFSPQGYSLNAIKEQYYYSIHVTPNSPSYSSFETNYPCVNKDNKSYFKDIIENLTAVFQPKSFNTLIFRNIATEKNIKLQNYKQTSSEYKALGSGYEAYFYNFESKKEENYKGERNE